MVTRGKGGLGEDERIKGSKIYDYRKKTHLDFGWEVHNKSIQILYSTPEIYIMLSSNVTTPKFNNKLKKKV